MVVTARIITTKCTFSWLLLLLGIVVSVRAGIKPAADDRAKEIIKGAVDDRGSQEASSIDYTATAAVDDRGGHKVEDAIKKNKVDEDSSLDYTTTAAVDDRGGHKVDDAIKKTTTEDCMILETNIIADVLALGQDSKNQLFDTIERLQSRLHGEKQCTDSEWRINYGHLSYYKIGDGSPDGVGCHDLPLMGLDVTGMEWPYDTNDKGVNHQDFPAATVRKGMCNSGIPGMVLQCTPEPIQAKYSYDRPTNTYVDLSLQFLLYYRSVVVPVISPRVRPSVSVFVGIVFFFGSLRIPGAPESIASRMPIHWWRGNIGKI